MTVLRDNKRQLSPLCHNFCMSSRSRKALRIELRFTLPNDKVTEEVVEQIRDFLFDEIPVEDYDLKWEPFDCKAVDIELLEELVNVQFDDDLDDGSKDEPFLLHRKLDQGES